MINKIHKILHKLIIAAVAICVAVPAMGADANLPMADVGDWGNWATETNRERLNAQIADNVAVFAGNAQQQLVDDYVPIEAKIGLAFMNAMSFVADVLDTSLVRFVVVFIILAYLTWIMFEAYTIITGKSEVKGKIKEMVKKGAMVMLWTAILSIGPAKTFMAVMSPIMQLATYISDFILNAVTQVTGATIPDTCNAIRQYAASNISDNNLLNPSAAADIMCVPTRLSGFCYTAVAVGWKWMAAGIGRSAFAFLCGGVFVGGFIYLAWRFAFIAFGVIADLFLGIIMLPFTAIAETIGKTSYKGILGDIFNGFMGLFSSESLQTQIGRFINAALHFVALAIVIAVASGLLSGLVNLNASQGLPEFQETGFWVSILIAALTWYLASNATKLATDFGGAIDHKMGDVMQNDVQTLWRKTKNTVQDWWKIIKESKK